MRKPMACLLSFLLAFSLMGYAPVSAFADSVEGDDLASGNGEEQVETDGPDNADEDDLPADEPDGDSDGPAENLDGVASDFPTVSGGEPVPVDDPAPVDPTVVKEERVYTEAALSGFVHVQNIGNMAKQTVGLNQSKQFGTSGRSLRVESLSFSVATPATEKIVTTYSDGSTTETTPRALSGGIEYEAHVQSIGWQGKRSNGAMAGTSGRSLRVEALRVRLTGELADRYDLYYRAHVQKLGWLDWAKNGSEAGSAGAAYRVECLEVRLVPKNAAAPGATKVPYVPSAGLQYRVHVQNIGDQGMRSGGAAAGTTGRSLRLENIRISVPGNTVVKGGVQYRTHVQNIGWQNWVSDGAEGGTHGRSLRMEAISIKLTGDLAKYYDVYYRVHAQNFGWLGWAKNGQDAGTAGYGYRLEALQVKLVAKGGAVPGGTGNRFVDGTNMNADQRRMLQRIGGQSSRSRYLIGVDTAKCRVGIFQGSAGNWRSVKWWPCGPGKMSTPTVKGSFTVQGRGYSFGSGFTCYYWTQFYGNYLFHSVTYRQGTRHILDPTLGRPVSHGCVRLDINNAKWIYDNIPRGTKVVVY